MLHLHITQPMYTMHHLYTMLLQFIMHHLYITLHQHTMRLHQIFSDAVDHNLLVDSVVQVDLVDQTIAGQAEQAHHVLAQLAKI